MPRLLFLLLILVLPGCASRSSQSEIAASPAALAESDVIRLISVWQDRLCRYIEQKGNGDEAVLSELRGMRSRNALRPAHITFGVLDVDAALPERHGWDVQGVLIGTQKGGAFKRYVFVVGIVGYNHYLPTGIEDIRLVGMSPLGAGPVWETSAADAAAVTRYRASVRGRGASRFPGDDDDFSMKSSPHRVSVRELRSGAEWSLELRAGEPLLAAVVDPGSSAASRAGRGCGEPRL